MKRHKTLISGVTDFAHLNDYIFLANFKLENLLYTRGFDRSFISKITECCFLFFPQTWTQNHNFPIWYNCGLKNHAAVRRDLPNKKQPSKLPSFHNVSL